MSIVLNVSRLKVPNGFRAELGSGATIVTCWNCRRQWRVPPQMAELSRNAWLLLQAHAEGHRPVRRSRRRFGLPATGGYGDVG